MNPVTRRGVLGLFNWLKPAPKGNLPSTVVKRASPAVQEELPLHTLNKEVTRRDFLQGLKTAATVASVPTKALDLLPRGTGSLPSFAKEFPTAHRLAVMNHNEIWSVGHGGIPDTAYDINAQFLKETGREQVLQNLDKTKLPEGITFDDVPKILNDPAGWYEDTQARFDFDKLSSIWDNHPYLYDRVDFETHLFRQFEDEGYDNFLDSEQGVKKSHEYLTWLVNKFKTTKNPVYKDELGRIYKEYGLDQGHGGWLEDKDIPLFEDMKVKAEQIVQPQIQQIVQPQPQPQQLDRPSTPSWLNSLTDAAGDITGEYSNKIKGFMDSKVNEVKSKIQESVEENIQQPVKDELNKTARAYDKLGQSAVTLLSKLTKDQIETIGKYLNFDDLKITAETTAKDVEEYFNLVYKNEKQFLVNATAEERQTIEEIVQLTRDNVITPVELLKANKAVRLLNQTPEQLIKENFPAQNLIRLK